jgi:hypothetical protein
VAESPPLPHLKSTNSSLRLTRFAVADAPPMRKVPASPPPLVGMACGRPTLFIFSVVACLLNVVRF